MKTLSTLKAGDLTWNRNGDAIIRRQHPVSLELKNNDNANLSVTVKNQVYLVGTENSKFNFSNFEHDTNSNVRLMTGSGIFTNGDTTINAKDLIAYGGKGNVGEKNYPLRVNLTGSLDANSGDSVYVSSVGDNKLTVQAVAANNDVSLQSNKDMVMTTETGKTGGYILGKNISLETSVTMAKIRELENKVTEGIEILNSHTGFSSADEVNYITDVAINLRNNVNSLKTLYQNYAGIGVANDGLRIYSNAPQLSSAPHVSINAGGAIINNVGTGVLYFDSITAPSEFGLKTPNVAGFSDSSFKNRSSEILNVYKQGFQRPAFKYTVDELNSFLEQL